MSTKRVGVAAVGPPNPQVLPEELPTGPDLVAHFAQKVFPDPNDLDRVFSERTAGEFWKFELIPSDYNTDFGSLPNDQAALVQNLVLGKFLLAAQQGEVFVTIWLRERLKTLTQTTQ